MENYFLPRSIKENSILNRKVNNALHPPLTFNNGDVLQIRS